MLSEVARDLDKASLARVLEIFLKVVWVIILWVGFVGKLVFGDESRFTIHLTNWAWVAATIFWTVDLFIPLLPRKFLTIHITGGFLLANGFAWAVFAGITVILAENAKVLEEAEQRFSNEVVQTLNTVYHVLPWGAVILYLSVNRDRLRRGLRWFGDLETQDSPWIFLVWLGIVWLWPSAPFIVYLSINDAKAIYGYTSPTWLLAGAGLVLIAIVNTAVVYTFARPRPSRKARPRSKDPSLESRPDSTELEMAGSSRARRKHK